MKRTVIFSAAMILPMISSFAHATDLLDVYQQAAKHNATYQAAVHQYEADRDAVPIARGPLLPSVDVTTASYTRNLRTDTNTAAFTLTATQNVFDYSDWKTYTKATKQLKADALTLEIAQQTLVNDAATTYFAVLEAQENVRYAKANERSLKEAMDQADQQYKVGLKPITDVQSTRAQYEAAKAQRISDENAVHNAYQALYAYTGAPTGKLAHLKSDFKKVKPYPADPQAWTKTAMIHNLDILQADANTDTDRVGIDIAKAGYYPTVTVSGSYAYTGVRKGSHTNNPSVALNGTLNIFEGGITKYAVDKARYTVQADQSTALQQRRTVASNTYSDYLTVLSDIAQIKAYNQAIVSGEASVKAAQAQYQVGTTTVYDLLREQAKLFSSQQSYTNALFKYITDSLQLKTDAGLITPKDIIAINKWLDKQAITHDKKES